MPVERQAWMLGLLQREKVAWQAAAELTANLWLLDPNDSVKYNFALFTEKCCYDVLLGLTQKTFVIASEARQSHQNDWRE